MTKLMNNVLTICALCISNILTAQDTTYFLNWFTQTSNVQLAKFYEVSSKSGDTTFQRRYKINDILVQEKVSKILGTVTVTRGYFDNGSLKYVEYKNTNSNNPQHYYRSYFENGNLKRLDTFDNRMNSINGKCFTQEGLDTLYYTYEIMPHFFEGTKGLNNFLSNNLVYPPKAVKRNIIGTVLIQMIIENDGKINNPLVLNKTNVHPILQKEALRLVNIMPNWIPGFSDGETTDVKVTLPIKFKLE